MARLRAECTAAKEALSTDTETTIHVAVPGLETEIRITRTELEVVMRQRMDDLLGSLERAVASAGMQLSDLAGVLLVGGSSRMPAVAELVGAATGLPTLIDADPKLVVAAGAAWPHGSADAPTNAAPAESTAAAERGPSSTGSGARGSSSAGASDLAAARRERMRRAVSLLGKTAAAGAVAVGGYFAYQQWWDGDAVAEASGPDDLGEDAFTASLAEAIFSEAAAGADSLDAFDAPAGGFARRQLRRWVGSARRRRETAVAAPRVAVTRAAVRRAAAVAGTGRAAARAEAHGTPSGPIVMIVPSAPIDRTRRRRWTTPTPPGHQPRPVPTTWSRITTSRPSACSCASGSPSSTSRTAPTRPTRPSCAATSKGCSTGSARAPTSPSTTPSPHCATSSRTASATSPRTSASTPSSRSSSKQDAGADGKPPDRPRRDPGAAMPGMPDMPDTTGGWGTSPPSVETIRMQLRERITKLSIPDGTDPADAAKLRGDLEGLLDRFRPGPGQSVDDAVAALRYEFEDRVRDFAQDQRIDALIEEQNEEDAAAEAAPPPAGGLTDVFDDMAGTPDGGNAPIGDSPPPTTTEPAEPAPAPDMTTMPAADTPPVAEAPADTAAPTATASTDDVLGTTAVEDAVAASSAPAPTPDATMEPATTAPAAVELPSIETPDVVELTADTADSVEGPDTMTVPDVADLGDDWSSEPEPDTQADGGARRPARRVSTPSAVGTDRGRRGFPSPPAPSLAFRAGCRRDGADGSGGDRERESGLHPMPARRLIRTFATWASDG